MADKLIMNRLLPFDVLQKNPRGARYRQGGAYFTVGGEHMPQLGRAEDNERDTLDGFRAAGKLSLKNDPDFQAAVDKAVDGAVEKAVAAALEKFVSMQAQANPVPVRSTPVPVAPLRKPESPVVDEESGDEVKPLDDAPAAPNDRKLSTETAVEIRNRASAGETSEALAAEYGVTPTSINNVVAGRTYKDAGGPVKP